MLIRFSVENFLSFNSKQEFSMIPNKGINIDKKSHIIESEYAKVLRLGAIYGANAAGKSNLIKAMNFAKNVITDKMPLVTNEMFCKIDKDNQNKPSRFEFEFIKNDKCYAYGFEILLKDKKILTEWLYELTDKEQNCIFEREVKLNRLDFNIETNDEEDSMRMKLYKVDFASDTSKLLITDIRGTKFKITSSLYILKSVYDWFENDLIIIYPDQPLMRLHNFFDKENNDQINKMIKLFDTGITNIKQEKISQEKLKEELSSKDIQLLYEGYKKAEEALEEFINKVEDSSEKVNSRKYLREDIIIGTSVRMNNSLYNISGEYGKEPEINTIRTEHEKSFFDFSFKEESDGTRRLFDYLEILLSRGDNLNKVYIIDELERSLHPKITYRFIELFLKFLQDKKVQLIFTTHESTIMNQNLLRRDEIWFVERNKKNLSRIYSLDQFKERYDRKLDKAYLEGRYGAIPVFNDFTYKGDLNGSFKSI